jgi:hypothetical protein
VLILQFEINYSFKGCELRTRPDGGSRHPELHQVLHDGRRDRGRRTQEPLLPTHLSSLGELFWMMLLLMLLILLLVFVAAIVAVFCLLMLLVVVY